MASLGNPRTWIPYMNSKDCSQGFCSMYCPQWCYIVYPPPPPTFKYPNDDANSSQSFSPLIIAIIGILATAILLVTYYALISKYCGHRHNNNNDSNHHEFQENHNPSLHEPWHVSTNGLDEALIKSITVCKYKKQDGLFEVTDCSVCLSEFQDGESVRLLPKCNHAFHLPCIDTWLKSHSSCPLCRANIFTFNASTFEVQNQVIELSSSNENQHEDENIVEVVEEVGGIHGTISETPKPALRAFSDLCNFQGRNGIIEIRDEVYESMRRSRSVSMDHSLQSDVVVHMNEEQDSSQLEAGPSKRSQEESSKGRYKRRVLHCVLSPIAMKRSVSSGRFSFRSGRGSQGIIPL